MRHLRRLGLSAATGLAAVLCSAPLAMAAAGPTGTEPAGGGGGGGGGKDEVINLTVVPTQSHSIDVPPPGPSQGDQLIVSGNLLRSAVEVGSFDEFCVVTATEGDDEETVQCQVTLSLPKGRITLQGVFELTGDGPGDITLAVTGGTGDYRAARGYGHVVAAGPTETQLSLHLTR